MAEESTPKRRKAAERNPVGADANQMPHNAEMERAVIAAILIEPEYCVGKSVEVLHSEHAFFVPAYRQIYRVVRELFDSGTSSLIDILTISNRLKVSGTLDEIGGDPFLADIQNSIATTANFETWLSVVHDYFLLRKMIQACTDSIHRCRTLTDHFGDPLTPSSAIDAIESDVLKVREHAHQQNVLHFEGVISEAHENITKIFRNEIEPAIPTGFDQLDYKIRGGLKKGEMFVLAARPSIGKTSFALNITRNILKQNKKVAFFSLEMTEEQIATRLLCNYARISESDIRPNAPRMAGMMAQFERVIKELKQWPLFIDPTPSLRVMELRAKASRLKNENNIDVIIIDYLQLMRGAGNPDSRQQEVAEISMGIKSLAKELKVPIIALAQLSRESEKGTNEKPKLSHLRESGAIEQDADVVAFLHRNRDTQKALHSRTLSETQKKDTIEDNGEIMLKAECIIEKNRNGETGYVNLGFLPKYTDFCNILPEKKYTAKDHPKGN